MKSDNLSFIQAVEFVKQGKTIKRKNKDCSYKILRSNTDIKTDSWNFYLPNYDDIMADDWEVVG